jgi:hypothetical protein
VEELGETLSSGLREVLSGKSKAIAQVVVGVVVGVEWIVANRRGLFGGMSHARNARDATGELRKEGAIVGTLHFLNPTSLFHASLIGDLFPTYFSMPALLIAACVQWRFSETLDFNDLTLSLTRQDIA